VTARWVVDDVASERNLKVKWQPISLLFKNEPPTDSPYYDAVVGTHGQLRVMESIRAAEGDDAVFGVYWDFASRIHHDGDRDFDIAKALEELGIEPGRHCTETVTRSLHLLDADGDRIASTPLEQP